MTLEHLAILAMIWVALALIVSVKMFLATLDTDQGTDD